MCWKCRLCLCCCSAIDHDADARNEEINRQINSDQERLKEKGVRSVENKNWVRVHISQTNYFLHGTSVGPAAIRESGLDPSYAREECNVEGVHHKQFILAFPCVNNVVPQEVKLSGAAKVLWGEKGFPFIYVFHVESGAELYQPNTGTVGATGVRTAAETGFPALILWAQIDAVFQYDEDQQLYVPNPIVNIPQFVG